MPRTFEKLDPTHKIPQRLAAMMDKYHRGLAEAGVTIDVLLVVNANGEGEHVDPALKLHGDACKAIVKINSYEARVKGESDVTIKFDGHHWEEWPDEELDSICDHELVHVTLVVDQDGGVKRDDCGRPKLKMRPHDFVVGGFDIIAERHGEHATEVQAVKEIGSAGVRQGWLIGF